MRVANNNYPDTVQLGDVRRWREWDIDWASIDLLFAGSPCQGFSFAGKQLAFDDPRSALFFTFVEIWRHIKALNPSAHYLLENVRMAKAHELVISRYMGVAPLAINSKRLSAQSRPRLYWTSIANEPYGLFGDMRIAIPQPADRGVLVGDILQPDDEVDDKYFLSAKALARAMRRGYSTPQVNPAKAGTLNTKSNSGQCSCDGGTVLIVASRGRNPANPADRSKGLNTEQRLEPRRDGKSNCLTQVEKDNYLLKPGQWLRRLTPIECERLQTVPDNYTAGVSDTQRYKMLGNGWTVDIIAYILQFLFTQQQEEL
jgi:DNA-cytosine methyltransferase